MLFCRQFCHFAKECLEKDTSIDKVQHREERPSKCKGYCHLYEEGQEKDMAAMCHHGTTCGATKCNREYEEYHKKLNQ